jgi:hypothetical protein
VCAVIAQALAEPARFRDWLAWRAEWTTVRWPALVAGEQALAQYLRDHVTACLGLSPYLARLDVYCGYVQVWGYGEPDEDPQVLPLPAWAAAFADELAERVPRPQPHATAAQALAALAAVLGL